MSELTGAAAAAVWANRIVGHADVPPAQLIPNPRNWRTHPAEQRRALAGALAEVGWVGEVLVNRTTGRVVDGHLRVELAMDRAEPAVPVTYVLKVRSMVHTLARAGTACLFADGARRWDAILHDIQQAG